jgi:hypothetical protein
VRPLTWPVYSALLSARWWRIHDNYAGDWVFDARRADARAKDAPTPYASVHHALVTAEQRAGLAHEAYRALHGGRRHVVSEVIELTGDRMLDLEYVGDIDAKSLRSYDRRVSSRIAKAAAVLDAREQHACPTRTSAEVESTIGNDQPPPYTSSPVRRTRLSGQCESRNQTSSSHLCTTKRHWVSIFRTKANRNTIAGGI